MNKFYDPYLCSREEGIRKKCMLLSLYAKHFAFSVEEYTRIFFFLICIFLNTVTKQYNIYTDHKKKTTLLRDPFSSIVTHTKTTLVSVVRFHVTTPSNKSSTTLFSTVRFHVKTLTYDRLTFCINFPTLRVCVI
jgi:hypothetical protein